MVPATVSAATGVLNPVIGKLITLLSDEYKLISGVKRGIRFLRDELSSMKTALEMLADDNQIDPLTKEWRSKVRELSYDIEDCIDRFMLHHSRGDAKANFLRKSKRKLKKLWGDHKIGKEIKELKARVVEEKERCDRYHIDERLIVPQPVVALDPRAPTFYEEVRYLVGIDGPREEIIGWLKSEERQLKVVSIYGIGGQGKTTLAMEVYRKIEEPFDCRASVIVSRTLDIKKLLRGILFQINKSEYDRSESWETEQLILTLREHLTDKRYLIVVDDIWTTSAWEHVKSALPANENRSRIITTTRIRDVAKSCCTNIDGHMYEAKPLSEDDSRILFTRRTFGSSKDCPQELKELANDILRKCGGLPLAIISIAGLLANKSPTVEVWVKIQKSASSAVEKDSPIDKMKRIVFLSYFDLPHYLKTCLLYLSVFPEDYSINARDLIWRWVAEGLIPGHNRVSMERLGESYLNELINRSMIQPTNIGADGTTVKFCRVHDVVLDFIVCQAMQDNFVTTLNANDVPSNSSYMIRRLSIYSNIPEAAERIKQMKNVSHLRSIHMVGYDIQIGNEVPWFLNCDVLRVLNIEGSTNFKDHHVVHIGNFTQLKYLRITGTGIRKLPEQISNLQSLEILDLTSNQELKKLPASIVLLQKLVRLLLPIRTELPDGIQNLQALEVLTGVELEQSVERSAQLRALTNLRELEAYWTDHYHDRNMKIYAVLALLNLIGCSLQSLRVYGRGNIDFAMLPLMFECPSISPLRRLVLFDLYWSSVPSQIGSLVNLTRLRITLRGVNEEGMKIIASLPLLLSLTIMLDCYVSLDVYARHVINSQGFQRLVKFNLVCEHEAALLFEAGAMPRLQRLKLELMAQCQFKFGHGGLLVGIHHLLALKHMDVRISCEGAVTQEVKAVESDIRDAADAHPNRPTLKVLSVYHHMMREPDDHGGALENNDEVIPTNKDAFS